MNLFRHLLLNEAVTQTNSTNTQDKLNHELKYRKTPNLRSILISPFTFLYRNFWFISYNFLPHFLGRCWVDGSWLHSEDMFTLPHLICEKICQRVELANRRSQSQTWSSMLMWDWSTELILWMAESWNSWRSK